MSCRAGSYKIFVTTISGFIQTSLLGTAIFFAIKCVCSINAYIVPVQLVTEKIDYFKTDLI